MKFDVLNCLFPLDVQNEIQLLSGVFTEKTFQQGFEAAPYKGITNGINVKRKLRDRHFLGIVRVTDLIHF